MGKLIYGVCNNQGSLNLHGIGCKNHKSLRFSTGWCFQVWWLRMLWYGSNDSLVSQELIGTLIMNIGQVVFELWSMFCMVFLGKVDSSDLRKVQHFWYFFFKLLPNGDHLSELDQTTCKWSGISWILPWKKKDSFISSHFFAIWFEVVDSCEPKFSAKFFRSYSM